MKNPLFKNFDDTTGMMNPLIMELNNNSYDNNLDDTTSMNNPLSKNKSEQLLNDMLDELGKVIFSLQSDMIKVMSQISQLNLLITKIKTHRDSNNNLNPMINMGMNKNMMGLNNMINDMNNNLKNNNMMINNMMNNNMMSNNIMNNNMMNNNMMNNNLMKNNLMNDNMINNMNNSMDMNPIPDKLNYITVIFRKEDNPIAIQCKFEDKISHIIDKYREKANDYNNKVNFIFNAKNLNKNLTVVESGLNNGANIFVITYSQKKAI